MAKYTPDTVSSGFNTASKINENFTDIATELNDKVLYRDNPIGEPNTMQNDLDMNSNDILNAASIDTVSLSINGKEITAENAAVSTLPDQTGNAGKHLYTNGATASWEDIPLNVYSTVSTMSASALESGDLARTNGYTVEGDLGAATYVVESGDTSNSFDRILLASGNTAVLQIKGGMHLVDQYGAVGAGDHTLAVQAAYDAAGSASVKFSAGRTYNLTDQLNPAVGCESYAVGATLLWTSFGTALASTKAEKASTGNAMRLLSRNRVVGGTWQTNNVATPSGVSIPAPDFSGAFWNMFAIGHFNAITTDTPEVATSGISLLGVKTEILAGDRGSAILGAGLVHQIVVDDFQDDSGLSSGAGTGWNGMEFTWGSGVIANSTYHPYNIQLQNIKVKGTNLGAYEGIRFSGCYDSSIEGYRSEDTQEALTFYIGDPGTNPINGNAGQDSSRIGTGLSGRDIVCDKFNIGIQILGEGAGSTHTDPKTNLMDVNISDFTLIGNGKTTNTAPWTSNVGIFANTARGYEIGIGTIRECYAAGISHSSSAGGAFTVPDEIKLDSVHIYNCGRDGLKMDTVTDSKLKNLKIHNTNESGATPNASINLTDATDNDVIDCRLGKVGDSTRVSINADGTSANNHVIRTHTMEEAAGVYVESSAGMLVVHGDCTDTGSTTTSADRFSRIGSLLNYGLVRPSSSIATGVLTVNGTNNLGDTEAAAASDDLTDIVLATGLGVAKIGDRLTITPASSSRTISVRHATGAGGTQTRTKSGATEAMTGGPTEFQYDGNAWWKLN